MKKTYHIPTIRLHAFEFVSDLAAPVLTISGNADGGTVVDAKLRQELEEDQQLEEEAFIHLMHDRETGNTSDLW